MQTLAISIYFASFRNFNAKLSDIHKQIQHFFNMVDVDKSQTISLLEFFIELPKVEAYLLEKKLGK